jgi:YidC/Oxa1 family membrane protein insertase
MEAPGFKISIALIIPILAGLTQWLSTKIMEMDNPNRNAEVDDENTMAKSMKSMNTIMPLFSVFICISLPACLGLYWIASSVVRTVIQLFVNHNMKKMSIEDLIRSNIEKQNKKREKKGLAPISADASIRTTQRTQEILEQRAEVERIRQEKMKELKAQGKLPETDLEKKNPGSIAAKARMVQEYNERTGGKK